MAPLNCSINSSHHSSRAEVGYLLGHEGLIISNVFPSELWNLILVSHGTVKSSNSTLNLANALSNYVTFQDEASGNIEKLFWRYSLACNAFEEMSAKLWMRTREPYTISKEPYLARER